MSVDATKATWELKKYQITSSEKLFLLSCADRAGEEGICWPSLPRLAQDTCLDIKTVKSVRQSCINKKLIRYTGEFKGKTKQIPVMQLLYVKERHVEENNEPQNGLASDLNKPKTGLGNKPKTGLVKEAQKRATESNTSFNLSGEHIDLGDSSNTPPLRNPSHYKKDQRFMRFYNAYPKKIKPTDAWKAFKALKPTDELLDATLQDRDWETA